MSRLFPERLACGVGPGDVAALAARSWPRHCRVTVILANALVRYAVIPWSAALSGEAEEEAYVRHHFARVHAGRAQSWALRWERAGAARLASAVDAELLAAVRQSFQGKKNARLVSIQPALMAAANRWGAAIPAAGAWLVLAEPERACIALHARGEWRAVRNGRGDWLSLLERERHRVTDEAPALALLAGARADREAPGWRLRELPA